MNLSNSGHTIGAAYTSIENPYLSAIAELTSSEKEPSSESLHLLFDYAPDSGKLYWKSRPPQAFKNPLECNRWNTSHAGKLAGSESWCCGRRRNITVSQRWEGKKKYRAAQRLIWIMTNGPIPEKRVIDHINGDPFDNRLANLRVATMKQNCQNRKVADKNTRRFKGVKISNKNPGRFQAVFQGSDGHRKHLGIFTSKEDAARAYDAEALKYYGTFARLNFPSH